MTPRIVAFVVCGLWLAVTIWSPPDADGETIDIPGDATTLQEALATSDASGDSSDVINVATGTYVGNFTFRVPPPLTSKSVTIRAKDGAKVVLRAGSTSDSLVAINDNMTVTLERLILVTSGEGVVVSATTATAILRNLVITGLASTGIRCAAATSGNIVEHVTFFRVTNGVDCPTSTITIRNNIFSNLSGTPISPFSVSGFTRPRFNLFFQSGTSGERGTDEVQPGPGDDLNPQFVDSDNNDFHLQEGSAAIDAGEGGEDVGAYGGPSSHTVPFPPAKPSVSCGSPDATTCTVTWTKNLDYAVTGYLVLSSAPSAPSPDYSDTTAADNATANCAAPATTCSATLSALPAFSSPPAQPSTPTALIGDSKVQLSWPAVSNASFYEVYVGTAPDAVTVGSPALTVSTNGALVEGLVNGTTYYFSVRAVSQPRLYAAVRSVYGTVSETATTVSEISEPANAVAYGTPLFSARSLEVAAAPQEVVGFPPLEDAGGCFIATAAYGSAMAPQVDVLRTFRERVLRPSPVGRAFIRWYERWSPPLAELIRGDERLRATARVVLWPAVGVAWTAIHAPWLFGLAAVAAGAAGWLVIRRRYGAARG